MLCVHGREGPFWDVEMCVGVEMSVGVGGRMAHLPSLCAGEPLLGQSSGDVWGAGEDEWVRVVGQEGLAVLCWGEGAFGGEGMK